MTDSFPACRTEIEGLERLKKPKSSVKAVSTSEETEKSMYKKIMSQK